MNYEENDTYGIYKANTAVASAPMRARAPARP